MSEELLMTETRRTVRTASARELEERERLRQRLAAAVTAQNAVMYRAVIESGAERIYRRGRVADAAAIGFTLDLPMVRTDGADRTDGTRGGRDGQA